METRHSAEGPFGSEFPAICNHCGVMVAWSRKTWKFCEHFCVFWKYDPSQTVAIAQIAHKLPGPAPFWLTLFQISSKSVHCRRSYSRTREDRFCTVEYFQYRFFEPIMTLTDLEGNLKLKLYKAFMYLIPMKI